ncbi:MAG: DUF111 family protein [Dehalococcoidia bacterium]|nr:DUF111 family protein [Dehalococcoidia bacterium]
MAQRQESPLPSLLLLAQVDHACGDIISSVMEQLTSAGARNVHLVPSLTKKGRPGYLLYVDVPADRLAEVEQLLALELGVLGWRILEAEHRTTASVGASIPVSVDFGEVREALNVPSKLLSLPEGFVLSSVEHDFCVRLQQRLREEHGVHVSLSVLKSSLVAAVQSALVSSGSAVLTMREHPDNAE